MTRSIVIGAVATTMIVAMMEVALAGFEGERKSGESVWGRGDRGEVLPGRADRLHARAGARKGKRPRDDSRSRDRALADTHLQLIAVAEVFRYRKEDIERMSARTLVLQGIITDLLREIRERDKDTVALVAAIGATGTEEEKSGPTGQDLDSVPEHGHAVECDLALARDLSDLSRQRWSSWRRLSSSETLSLLNL